MKRTFPILIAGALACGSPATEEKPPDPLEQPAVTLRIATVNYPLAWMASRLLPSAEVLFAAPPGIDPADWQPGPQTIATVYHGADVIALNGAGYARWVTLATLPEEALLDTSGAIQDRLLPRPGVQTHSHGPEGEHTHAQTANTLWLDPTLAFAQAQALAAVLKEKDPKSAAEIDANLAAVETDLTELDGRLERAFAGIADSPVLTSHPVYAYLEKRYGLDARSLHWEPDVEPTPEDWRDLAHLLSDHLARWMIWEAEPSAETRARLEERDLAVVVFSLAANTPAAGDFLTVMQENAAALEEAFAVESP